MRPAGSTRSAAASTVASDRAGPKHDDPFGAASRACAVAPRPGRAAGDLAGDISKVQPLVRRESPYSDRQQLLR